MKTARGNLFFVPAEALCITTNGFVKANGEAVMGRGCARQFTGKYPTGPAKVGAAIRRYGNRVNYIGKGSASFKYFYTFPVKDVYEINDGENVVQHAKDSYQIGQRVPGFHCKARLDIIVRSCEELVEIADEEGFERVVIPRMGCGAGELLWADVKPQVEHILDDRFTVITY